MFGDVTGTNEVDFIDQPCFNVGSFLAIEGLLPVGFVLNARRGRKKYIACAFPEILPLHCGL